MSVIRTGWPTHRYKAARRRRQPASKATSPRPAFTVDLAEEKKR